MYICTGLRHILNNLIYLIIGRKQDIKEATNFVDPTPGRSHWRSLAKTCTFIYFYFSKFATSRYISNNALKRVDAERNGKPATILWVFIFIAETRYNGPYHWHLINQPTILFESSLKIALGLETIDVHHIPRTHGINNGHFPYVAWFVIAGVYEQHSNK